MSALDRLLPPEIRRGDPDRLHRARLLAGFVLALLPFGLAHLLQFSLDWQPVPFALVVGGVLTNLLTFGVLRWRRSVVFAGNWYLTSLWLSVTLGVVDMDGIESPAMTWALVLLLIAVTLLGPRASIGWLVATLVTVAMGYAASEAGLPSTPIEPHRLSLVVSCTACLMAVYFVARFYEQRKVAMLSEVTLARKSAESAHATARLVLDNVAQGLMLADPEGRLAGESSKALFDWFGDLTKVSTVFEFFERVSPKVARWLRAGYADVFQGELPLEVRLAQLPSRFERAERHYAIVYHPVFVGERLAHLVLVLSDVTDVVLAERAEEEQRELVHFIRAAIQDGRAFMTMVDEFRERVARVCFGGGDHVSDRRELHTLKSSAALLGLERSARFCHDLEDASAEGLTPEQRRRLADHFAQLEAKIAPLLVARPTGVEISEAEYEAALLEARRGGCQALVTAMSHWTDEPTRAPLTVLARQAQSLAQRLDKGMIRVAVADGGLRLPRERFAPLWASLAHVVRNAVDHGLEGPGARLAAGKGEAGHLTLATRREGSNIVVEVTDDGGGIAWESVRALAVARGLPASTPEELVATLLADGITTREQVTELSGRGVGLAAVRAAITRLGGRVEVVSRPGQGARFRFHVPETQEPTGRRSSAAPPLQRDVAPGPPI